MPELQARREPEYRALEGTEESKAAERSQPEGDTERTTLLRWIWYAGMGITATVFLVTNLVFYVRLRNRRVPFRIDCALPVYRVPGLSAPCLFGRSIYLCDDGVTGEQTLRHILAHEMSHYRHADSLWSFLRCAALILHWYNPLVWFAAVLSRQDSELRADAGALKELGAGERKSYGLTVLQMAAGDRGKTATLFCAFTPGNYCGKKLLRERIEMIAGKRSAAPCAVALGVVLCLLAAACAFTGEKQRTPQTGTVYDALRAPEEGEQEEKPFAVLLSNTAENGARYIRYTDDSSCKVLYDAWRGMVRGSGETEVAATRPDFGYTAELLFPSGQDNPVQFTYGFVRDGEETRYGVYHFDPLSENWTVSRVTAGKEYWDILNRYYLSAQSGEREIINLSPQNTAAELSALMEQDPAYYRQQAAKWYAEVTFCGESFSGGAGSAEMCENLAQQCALRWCASLLNASPGNPFRCVLAEVRSCDVLGLMSAEGIKRLSCETTLIIEAEDVNKFALCMPLEWTLEEKPTGLRLRFALRSEDGLHWRYEACGEQEEYA